MEQSRLKQLRRKRILLRMMIWLPYGGILALKHLWLWLGYVVGFGVAMEISYWCFGSIGVLQLFSREMRELDDYEKNHLKPPAKPRSKWVILQRILFQVLVLAGWFVANSLVSSVLDFLSVDHQIDHAFPYMVYLLTTSCLMLFVFYFSLLEDRSVDRRAQHPHGRKSGMEKEQAKKVMQDLQRVDEGIDEHLANARILNAMFLAGTILFLDTVYYMLSRLIHSDAVLPLTYAAIPLALVVTYLFTRRLNPYYFISERVRLYEAWKRVEIGEEWNLYQRWGFVAAVIWLVILLVAAYFSIDHHLLEIDTITLYLDSIFIVVPLYLLWKHADRALLPLVPEAVEEEQ